MAQPTGQVLVDTGNALAGALFAYANGTGLWDATNGAMLTKTGTGAVSVEGGANVINSNGTTFFDLASVIAQPGAYTAAIRCRTTGLNNKAMVLGSPSATNNWLWINDGSNNLRACGSTVGANPGSTTMTTYHVVRDGLFQPLRVYENGTLTLTLANSQGNNLDVSRIMGGHSTAALNLDGALEFVHLLPGVALTAEQVASLAADPYQVLVSAAPGPDVTAPTLTGVITLVSKTASSISISYPAGSDDVGVVAYDVSSDAGATWTDNGTALAYTFTGLSASTAYALRVRARDAAPNVSTPPLALSVTTDAPPSGTITLTSPAANTMRQRSLVTGLASFTAAGSATAGGIEYRWAGGAWATLVASHPGGAYSQAVTLPTGQGTLEVRLSGEPAVTASAALITVGDLFATSGQSNHVGAATSVVLPVASVFTALEHVGGAWVPLRESTTAALSYSGVNGYGGSYFGALSNRLQAQGVPVGFVPCAAGSTTIAQWQKGQSLYTGMVAKIAAVGGVRANLFWLGESNANNSPVQATFAADLNQHINDVWADLGIQTFINKIVRWIPGADVVRAAQDDVIASNTHVAGWADCDVYAPSGVHYTTTTDINNVADRVYAGMVTAFYSGILSGGADSIGYADAGGISTAPIAALTGGADALGYVDGGGVAAPGVLGWVILLTTAGGSDGAGFLHNDVLPGDEYKRFTFNITRQPTLGTLTTYPDGTFTYSGLADTFEYEGFADDISYGVAEVAVGTPIADVTLSGASDAIGYRDAGGAMLPDLIALTGGADAMGYIDAGGSAFDPGSTLAAGSDSIGYLDAGGAMFTDLVALSGGADSIGYLDAGTIFYSLTRGRAPSWRTAIYRRA